MRAERLRAREYGNLALAGRMPRSRKRRVYRRFRDFSPCAARIADCIKDGRLLDPAAGTGTLVLAAAHRIGEERCTIYTQDRSQKANEFMRLNLILNNLVHSLPHVVSDDTLASPRHLENNDKAIKRFDYIVSNPPFKADFSDTRDALAGDAYKTRFWAGVPNITGKPEKMEIYLMFLQHIVASLADGGRAAVVVPTGILPLRARFRWLFAGGWWMKRCCVA